MNIKKYQFEDQQISVVDQNGEPWFLAHEACAALEIVNSRDAVSSLDDDEKNTVAIADGIPGNPNKTVINESGLYRLIFKSRTDRAKRFQKWVTSEVLPSIRKTGSYSIEQLSRVEILRMALDSEEKRLEAEKQLALAAPKVDHYDRFMGSHDVWSMDNLAKSLGLGRNRMMAAMRSMRILKRNNVPFQEQVDAGRFVTKQGVRGSWDGMRLYPQTFATPKGVKYISDRVEEIRAEIEKNKLRIA